MQWPADKEHISGFLSPDVNGLRMLYDLKTRVYFPFQVDPLNILAEEIVTIGRFTFYQSAFDLGRRILASALEEQSRLLVIDEVGPLELQGRGFEPMVGEVVRAQQAQQFKGDLLLVVRDGLLEEVIKHYRIARYQFLEKELNIGS